MPKIIQKPENGRAEAGRDEPSALRPFRHHGLELADKGAQADGTCPLCRGRFTVEAQTGLWRCWSCQKTGNPLEFLRQLWAESDRQTNGWGAKLAADRGYLDRQCLTEWGVVRSVVDGAWLVPGYGVHDGKPRLDQLYRRVQVKDPGDGSWGWRLLPTPGVWPDSKAHALHMPSMHWDPTNEHVFCCEGPWDGIALWEVARQCKRGPTGTLEFTGDPRQSLVGCTNVVATPGCMVWREEWTDACRGRIVTMFYDNDHKDRGGRLVTAGADGVKRIAGLLSGVAKEVWWLQWGGGGYDAALPSGFDVRDMLTKGVPIAVATEV